MIKAKDGYTLIRKNGWKKWHAARPMGEYYAVRCTDSINVSVRGPAYELRQSATAADLCANCAKHTEAYEAEEVHAWVYTQEHGWACACGKSCRGKKHSPYWNKVTCPACLEHQAQETE